MSTTTAYQPLLNTHDGSHSIICDIEAEDEEESEEEEEIGLRNLTQNGRRIRGPNKRYYYAESKKPPNNNNNNNSSSIGSSGNGKKITDRFWFYTTKEIEDNTTAATGTAAMNGSNNNPPNPTSTSHHSSWSSWPRQGTRKGLIMALTTAIILILLVVLTAVYVENKSITGRFSTGLSDNRSAVTLDDYLEGKFSAIRFNGTWISDDEIQYFNDNGDLVVYNVKSNSEIVILKADVMAENLNGFRVFEAVFSADRLFILLGYSRQQIFRHSSVAKYEIYDIEMKEFIPLVPSLSIPDLSEVDRFHQLVVWSTVGNGIAFVHFSNIYYKANARSRESSQLTFDETMNVLNGITDWVYEEEMFATSTALWFSPDGSNMAFVTFNDTDVEKIHYPLYGTSAVLLQYPYPHLENLSYPKSGRRNPTARITLVSFADNITVINPAGQKVQSYRMLKNIEFKETPIEHYIGAAKWTTDSKLLVITLNRHQNESKHHLCDTQGSCEPILTTKISNGWIDVEVPHASTSGDSFLTLASQTQAVEEEESDGSLTPRNYRHILQFNKDSTKNRPITAGFFSVDNIVGWDEVNGRVYFTAPGYNKTTKKTTPSQSHLWYADLSKLATIENAANLVCLTCSLRTSVGEPCIGNSIELSKKFSYFVDICNGGPYHPPEIVVRSTKNPESNALPWTLNPSLRRHLASVSLPTYKDFEIQLPGPGNPYKIRARIFLPPNLDETKKYPLLVDVYGGPASQRIANSYVIDWSTTLVTSKQIIYATIDGRGSGRQSDDLKFQVYRRLGTVEVLDQINGGEWLVNNVPFIDGNRTAIWGWSYGGYATAMAMGLDFKNVYKCGISVAPVTNWLLYDTIYTERYMGLPTFTDNYAAYNSSDVTHYVENFRNKKFYLVHGNADDNVHYQQSMILSRALERSDILFRQQSYPDESHGLSGVRPHLYHSLENFLSEECF